MAQQSIALLPASDLCLHYSFGEVVGQGQFGRVWRCTNRATGEVFACKQVRKERLSANELESLHREVAVMQALRGHPHVLELLGLFEDDESVYLLTDLCTDGDLFEHVIQSGGIQEPAAAALFAQVAEAVRWCHSHSIVHRDIKPENILLTSPAQHDSAASPRRRRSGPRMDVRLADFGLAMAIPKGFALRGAVGSAPYEAPEVLASDAYGVKADVWSMGVLLYAMLAGRWPSFLNKQRVLIPEVDFAVAPWPSISHEAKDLIRRMMAVDPARRLDIYQVLRHPWLAPLTTKAPTRADQTSSFPGPLPSRAALPCRSPKAQRPQATQPKRTPPSTPRGARAGAQPPVRPLPLPPARAVAPAPSPTPRRSLAPLSPAPSPRFQSEPCTPASHRWSFSEEQQVVAGAAVAATTAASPLVTPTHTTTNSTRSPLAPRPSPLRICPTDSSNSTSSTVSMASASSVVHSPVNLALQSPFYSTSHSLARGMAKQLVSRIRNCAAVSASPPRMVSSSTSLGAGVSQSVSQLKERSVAMAAPHARRCTSRQAKAVQNFSAVGAAAAF